MAQSGIGVDPAEEPEHSHGARTTRVRRFEDAATAASYRVGKLIPYTVIVGRHISRYSDGLEAEGELTSAVC